jgi:ribosomal protein L11 methyltransferase
MAEHLMAWREIHLTTTAIYADLLSEELTERGALAATILDAGDQPIYEPEPNKPAPLWPDVKMIFLFDSELDLKDASAYLKMQQSAGTISQFSIKELPDEDWERRCLDQLEPMKFGKRLWICPSWITPPDPAAVNIILDPGLAFGTGTHPTTALCLEWLDGNIVPGQTVIDYGCGSGILALAAIKLGARKVIAIDHDDKALVATRENAKINNITPLQLETRLPDPSRVENVELLIANILAQPLIEMATNLAKLVKPGGKILLSGILKEQSEQVKAAYEPWFSMQPIDYKEEWCRLTGVRQ